MARQFLSRRATIATSAALLAAAALTIWLLRYPSPSGADDIAPLATPAAPGARLPRLAAHPQGGAALSWVESAADGVQVLRVARYRDGQFGKPAEVARGRDWFINWADFPSVVPMATDFWLAHWLVRHPRADSPYHYGIGLAVSRDDGRQWTPVAAPHADVGPAEHGFAAIAGSGERATMLWLDGRANDSRHTFTLRSADVDRQGGAHAEVIVDPDVCSCCWPAMARTAGNLWLAYRGRTADELRDMQLRYRTGDGWSAPIALAGEGWRIPGCPTNGVSLAARGERLAAAWFTAAGGVARVRVGFIRDGSSALDAVHDIDAVSPVGRPAIAWLDDDTAAVLHIAAPAAGATVTDLRLTTVTRAGIGRSRRIAELSANRDSGVPQLLAVDQELLIAWTAAAPGYGVQVRRISLREFVL